MRAKKVNDIAPPQSSGDRSSRAERLESFDTG
jgi:hypothetical protein